MGVALITPFKSDGSVDYNALVRLVEYQVQNGVDFLCVLGTTAETPTLTSQEWMPYWWPFLIIINLHRKAFTSTTRPLPKLQIFR